MYIHNSGRGRFERRIDAPCVDKKEKQKKFRDGERRPGEKEGLYVYLCLHTMHTGIPIVNLRHRVLYSPVDILTLHAK